MPLLKLSRLIVLGLMSLSLTMLLGCSTAPNRSLPDSAWYAEDIPVPTAATPLTNGALAQHALDLETALGLANADRAAIRAWAAQPKEK